LEELDSKIFSQIESFDQKTFVTLQFWNSKYVSLCESINFVDLFKHKVNFVIVITRKVKFETILLYNFFDEKFQFFGGQFLGLFCPD
jgi:hypothetical protein